MKYKGSDGMGIILGIDIGGTKCAVSVGTDDGELLARKEMATIQGAAPQVVLNDLANLGKSLLDENGIAIGSILGIGVSCGGPLNRKDGTICSPPNLPGWDNVPARAIFEDAFPYRHIELENDANATALAEWFFGAGKGTRNMLFLTMGTGVGAGLILDGCLYRGTNEMAGEVGHQTILINGPLCGCGKRGCLEALCSGPSIARLAKESLQYGRGKTLIEKAGGKPDNITARDIIECAKEGDIFSKKILEEAGTYMGIGLANLIMILNPERIVLGTIAVHAGELILDPIRKAIEEYAWKRSSKVCTVVPAGLGDRAQDYAAISLLLQDME
jgi:glucokinase